MSRGYCKRTRGSAPGPSEKPAELDALAIPFLQMGERWPRVTQPGGAGAGTQEPVSAVLFTQQHDVTFPAPTCTGGHLPLLKKALTSFSWR